MSHFSELGYIRVLIDENMLQSIDFKAFPDRKNALPPYRCDQPFTQSAHFGAVPQGSIGTLEVEFFGEPWTSLSL